MMLRKIVPFIFSLLFFSVFYAQTPLEKSYEYYESKPYNKQYEKARSMECFYYKGKAIAIKVGDFKYIYYQMYDVDNMSSIKTQTVVKRDQNIERYYPEGAIQKKDTVIQFFSLKVKQKGELESFKIYAQRICISTGEVSKMELLFHEKNYILPFEDRRIRIIESNSTHFVISYVLKKLVNKRVQKQACYVVYDSNMTSLWRKEVDIPYRKEDAPIIDVIYTSRENLVFLVQKKDDVNKVSFELWKLDEFSDSKKVINLQCGKCNSFIQNVKLKQGENGNFFMAGFIGELFLSNKVYFGEFDSTGGIIKEFINDIPLSIINEYNNNSSIKSNEKKLSKGEAVGIKGLTLRDFTVNRDGRILLHGEAYFTNKSDNYAGAFVGGVPMAGSEHFYESIFVTKIGSEGDVIWMNKMSKRQVRSGGGPGAFHVLFSAPNHIDLSYNYLETDNYHYFIYMDHEDNFDLPIDKLPYYHVSRSRGVLVAHRINDKTGEIEKIALIDTRKGGGMKLTGYETKDLVQINDNQFFIELYKGKNEDLLIKIELED